MQLSAVSGSYRGQGVLRPAFSMARMEIILQAVSGAVSASTSIAQECVREVRSLIGSIINGRKVSKAIKTRVF